jgi:hypothetical protein
MMKKKTKKTSRAVIVTTEHRGVFFGYADDTDGDQIALDGKRGATDRRCTPVRPRTGFYKRIVEWVTPNTVRLSCGHVKVVSKNPRALTVCLECNPEQRRAKNDAA